MLKKQNRLLKVSKSKEVATFSTPLFNLKISKGADESKKFGFIVSKKVSKSAVLRNRTKRILRSVVKEDMEKIESGKEILIISKKKLEWAQKDEVREVLENTFKKAGLLK